MSGNKTIHQMVLALALAVLGTARGAVPKPEEPAAKPVLVELAIGRVLHVNTNYNYVILQCGSLPSPGEEAKVCRGNDVVARLKINSADRFPFVAADVIEGQPQENDVVKQVMKKYAHAAVLGRKE